MCLCGYLHIARLEDIQSVLINAAISCLVNTRSMLSLEMACCGINGESAVAGSCAAIKPPLCCTAARPLTPSALAPDNNKQVSEEVNISAADSNDTSMLGRL